MQRYEVIPVFGANKLAKNSEGDYVLHSEAQAEIARRRADALREAAAVCDQYCEDSVLQPAAGWSDDEVARWEAGGLDHLFAARDAVLALIDQPADAITGRG